MALPKALWVSCPFCSQLLEAKVVYFDVESTEEEDGKGGIAVALQAFVDHTCPEGT